MLRRFKIQVEGSCIECEGSGLVRMENVIGDPIQCPDCEGEGWVIEYMTPGQFKDFLEECG